MRPYDYGNAPHDNIGVPTSSVLTPDYVCKSELASHAAILLAVFTHMMPMPWQDHTSSLPFGVDDTCGESESGGGTQSGLESEGNAAGYDWVEAAANTAAAMAGGEVAAGLAEGLSSARSGIAGTGSDDSLRPSSSRVNTPRKRGLTFTAGPGERQDSRGASDGPQEEECDSDATHRQLPSLRSWLRSLNLDEQFASLEVIDDAVVSWRDGLALVPLVEALEERSLHGVERSPKAPAQYKRNVEKALEVLRLKKGLPLTYLYATAQVARAEARFLIPLLAQVRIAYKARRTKTVPLQPPSDANSGATRGAMGPLPAGGWCSV